MTVPSISVVMGVRNGEATLRRAIDSILGQETDDLELIVVDDASTDSTPKILEDYRRVDTRVRVIRQMYAGLTAALVKGCEASRGKFIARHDADDWSLPERFRLQQAYLEAHPQVGFASCGTCYIGPGGENLGEVARLGEPEELTDRLLQLREGPPAHGSVMLRSSVYLAAGGYRLPFFYAQDADLWMRMAEQSMVGSVAEVLYFHTRDPGSISGARRGLQRKFGQWAHACKTARTISGTDSVELEEVAALRRQVLIGIEPGWSRSDLSSASYALGSELLKLRNDQCRAYFVRALRANPFNGRAWVRLLQSVTLFRRGSR